MNKRMGKTFFDKASGLSEQPQEQELEVCNYASKLQELLTQANNERVQIDRESAEALIQKDFLQ